MDLVSDSWTSFPSFSMLTGGAKTIGMDEIPDHITNLHQLDIPHVERIQARVDKLVHNQEVAKKLKAWLECHSLPAIPTPIPYPTL